MADADDWDNQTDYATMFGQGFSTTAIQGASLYQAIANGGVRMPVQLVERCRHADGTVTDVPEATGTPVVSADAAKQVSDMLEMVDRHSWVRAKVHVPGYRVAMKTSTAQQPDGEGGYSSNYLVAMAGFAPADAPRFVVSVTLAEPVLMNSSAAVAPIFRDVTVHVLKSLGQPPSTEPDPDLPLDF